MLETGPQHDQGDAEDAGYDAEGWARSLRLEYSLGATRGGTRSNTQGVAVRGHVDTPLHGTLSVHGNLLRSNTDGSPFGFVPATESRSWTGRVDQRALPLPGGWLANHGIGDIQTGVPGLGRGFSRVFLPTTPIAGIGGDWQLHDAASINASVGRPGLFSGFDIIGFQPVRGELATAGAQLRLRGDRTSSSRLNGALQVVQARDAADAGLPAGTQVRSAWSALGWDGIAPWADGPVAPVAADALSLRPGRARAQWNVVQSGGSAVPTRIGTWADAMWRTSRLQHTAGLFHFEPDLRWGVVSMPADMRGGYWRSDMATRQWQLGWSLEASESVTGLYDSSSYGSLYGRYQLNLRSAIDGTLALRRGTGHAESVHLNWTQATDRGQTRLRSSVLHTRTGTTRFLGVDQSWALSAPHVLATSLGWQGSSEPRTASPLWTWGLLASTVPLPRLAVEASMQGAHGGGTSAFFANVGVSWLISRDWSLGLRYTEARGEEPQFVEVVSALTAATQAPAVRRESSRSVQVTLRYETRAGTATVPLGGTRTSGAGSLGGTVFFDADRSGKREASEQGVPNVTVILDGKYVVRTDAAGRYSFPSVVAGVHTLQVQPDNVPLPWSPANPDPVKVEVLVRGSTVEDFAMQRER